MLDLIKDASSGILYYKWTANDPDMVFLLVHGMGAHSERWKAFADFLLSRSISSYSLELRGFGQTTDYKGHIDSLNVYYKDVSRLIEIIRAENPGKKIVLAGESMGGLIAFEFISKYPEKIDALVCFSPAFGNKMNINIPAVIIPLLYDPKRQHVMPFTSDWCTRDAAYQKIMDADPREHRFASSSLLLQLLFAQISSMFNAPKVQKPVMFLLAGDDKDKLVEPKAAKSIFKRMRGDNKKLIQYPDMLHALSIDNGKEKVFEDIYCWISGLK